MLFLVHFDVHKLHPSLPLTDINYKLTGKMVASSCNAASRWHHDGWDVLKNNDDEDNMNTGRPIKLYRALDMEDLASKLPQKTLAMGDVIGGLTEEAALKLGLPVGTKVVQVKHILYRISFLCIYDCLTLNSHKSLRLYISLGRS